MDVDDGPVGSLLLAGHVAPPGWRHGPKGLAFWERGPYVPRDLDCHVKRLDEVDVELHLSFREG